MKIPIKMIRARESDHSTLSHTGGGSAFPGCAGTFAGRPKSMNVVRLRQNLLRWYRRHRRPLPWRENPTPYRVWISEIMLQQTQAATVIPYYDRFLERFPDLESLAGARKATSWSYGPASGITAGPATFAPCVKADYRKNVRSSPGICRKFLPYRELGATRPEPFALSPLTRLSLSWTGTFVA